MIFPYKRINTLFGWVVFAISLLVYALTLEPSASYWDCGEFIAASYKLQVVHPPGAPLYLMLGRVFSLLAAGPGQVAFWVNMLSAVSSALCCMFTFWIITHYAQKIVFSYPMEEKARIIIIMGAGLTGALSLTFTDTFWFSAVEAEVYATSSLFTMLTFWAMLKWEERKDLPGNQRWLLLIALVTGLSIGVHLLNLLVIPAVAYVYYFAKYQFKWWGFIKATAAGTGLLLFIQFGVIPGLPQLAALADRVGANSLGWGIGTGAWLLLGIIGLLLTGFLIISRRKQWAGVHTALLCLCFVLIGYSSYIMVPVRSAANPPVDINHPADPHSLVSYLKREQYGQRALFYGPYFNAPVAEFKKGTELWRPENGKYVQIGNLSAYEYDGKYMTLFPRMGDYGSYSKTGYIGWTGVDATKPPSFGKNVEFFFKYQLLHMYVRYHLWNFAGRQNDMQGHGDGLKGNWMSGIGFIDNLIAAPQENLPLGLQKNRAHNTYYFLPLLLGIAGLWFQSGRDKKGFYPLLALFLFTGLILAFYLNIPPYEPRERDYAFVGSFQVFCVWIGLGAVGLCLWLHKWWKNMALYGLVLTLCLLAGPALLAAQNWDDHDRSGRSFARDYARNFLESLAPQSVLFVYGDNDTYPLWYLQNVEGVRTDVRVINANLLNTDWYAYQLRRKEYASEPLQLAVSPGQYRKESGEFFRIANSDSAYSLSDVFTFINNKNQSHTTTINNRVRGVFPSHKIYIPVKRQAGDVAPEDSAYAKDTLELVFSNNLLFRAEVLMLDIIASNPARPVYFASLSEAENLPQLNKYLRLEGLAYRLAPVQYPDTAYFNRLNAQQMAAILNRFHLEGHNNPSLYIDPEQYATAQHYRTLFSITAEKMLAEGKAQQAADLAQRCENDIPLRVIEYKYPSAALTFVKALFAGGTHTQAVEFSNNYCADLMQKITYYAGLEGTRTDAEGAREKGKNIKALADLKFLLASLKQEQKAAEIEKFLSFYNTK